MNCSKNALTEKLMLTEKNLEDEKLKHEDLQEIVLKERKQFEEELHLYKDTIDESNKNHLYEIDIKNNALETLNQENEILKNQINKLSEDMETYKNKVSFIIYLIYTYNLKILVITTFIIQEMISMSENKDDEINPSTLETLRFELEEEKSLCKVTQENLETQIQKNNDLISENKKLLSQLEKV